jgi:hypothetical protein
MAHARLTEPGVVGTGFTGTRSSRRSARSCPAVRPNAPVSGG